MERLRWRRRARHSVSVAAVLLDDHNRVLVVQRRDNGRWEPPGGILELDETVDEGLRREVLEETGLVVEPVRQTGVYKNMALGVVALVFHCEVTGGALASATPEARCVRWMTPDEICIHMHETFAVRVFDALERDRPLVARSHDGRHLDQTELVTS